MLGLGGYLLGVAELAILVGTAWLGATALRRHLTPELDGAPALLATAVLSLALLLLTAELLGSFGAFAPAPYLVLVALLGLGLWTLLPWVARGEGVEDSPWTARRPPHPVTGPAGRALDAPTLIALAIAAAAIVRFALEVKPHLTTGMTGFDSTWYHGPFAAGFFQSGDTWNLHFIAPQFLAWFYPANSELFHAVGMLAFGRDLLSPLLNLGWLTGCLLACWCIGRPHGVAPWSLALGAIVLSLPALSDQAGEARNDIVGIFFLLAAVAITLSAWGLRPEGDGERERKLGTGALIVAGLAAGMAAGTKLNFLLPAAVLVTGLAVIAPRGERWRSFGVACLGALIGGGYWYLRNLIHTGNPLPWVKHLGPVDLPAPAQALGGREGHSVLGYLTDGAIWSDWLLPGLHDGLTLAWPLLLATALASLLLCLGRRSDPALRVAGAVGLAAGLAWLIAPTSASGPDGIPRGFESGLRYLAPALVLGLTLLPNVPQLSGRLSGLLARSLFVGNSSTNSERTEWVGRRTVWAVAIVLAILAVGVGYPVQRHYLENRYESPTFTTPSLNAAFAWAQGIEDARIATTSTRQYPLFGRDLSNRVEYIGEEQPHGGFTTPGTCPQWRHLLNAGDYDYVVTSRDRIESGKPTYPATARWTAGPEATIVLRKPPTVIYKLKGKLDPSACRE